eukprot:gnl/MRDRNA2_/MRDRNA2_152153_c0_seq1.p1 gnl/MRDRNA2_/MRDRNA2_152153_c0~~gnl/MRDRNA2_/MRDRNA2_152153_c0_seq1.p1  ORF type:complete len:404 (-),score=64.77 gnl/MRDRNA2_/MRDRNA2_152153_c0_seq1:53-1264(-)
MCSAVFLNILLAFIVNAYSRELVEEDADSLQKRTDKLLEAVVDKLCNRVLQKWSLHGGHLDNTTVEKSSGRLAQPRTPLAASPARIMPTSLEKIRMWHSGISSLHGFHKCPEVRASAAETTEVSTAKDALLEVKNLWAFVSPEEEDVKKMDLKTTEADFEPVTILKGVNLTIRPGEVHAIMGKNGCGKSTLGKALIGDPAYSVSKGNAIMKGKDILKMEPEERSQAGLFMTFQDPLEVEGLSNERFLRMAYNCKMELTGGKYLEEEEFKQFILPELGKLKMDPFRYLESRGLNVGFSGGEKKRNEVLQMSVLGPDMAILDEIDSGLDVDALKIVSSYIKEYVETRRADEKSITPALLIITHYRKLLEYIEPDVVHIMLDGAIVTSGGREILDTLEKEGYDHWK